MAEPGAHDRSSFSVQNIKVVVASSDVQVRELTVGQSCRIDAGIIHRLTNGGMATCRYLLVQGGGRYDFNKQ